MTYSAFMFHKKCGKTLNIPIIKDRERFQKVPTCKGSGGNNDDNTRLKAWQILQLDQKH